MLAVRILAVVFKQKGGPIFLEHAISDNHLCVCTAWLDLRAVVIGEGVLCFVRPGLGPMQPMQTNATTATNANQCKLSSRVQWLAQDGGHRVV